MARPSSYDPQIAATICSQVAEGKSLVRVCDEADDLPAFRTVYNWFQTHPGFVQEYARAKEIMLERMADEINRIADDVTEDANSRRVRVDSRKWLLSKLIPKVYGDATLLKHADANGNQLEVQVTRVSPRPPKVIDVTPRPALRVLPAADARDGVAGGTASEGAD